MSTDSFARALALQGASSPANDLFLNLKGDFGATGGGVTDDSSAVSSALAQIGSNGGGSLFVPRGTYLVSSSFTLPANIRIFGESRTSSIFKSNAAGGGGASSDQNVRNGSIFYSNWPSNSSTPANITIEHIGLINGNAANVGAGFYDNGGSFVLLRNMRISGFQYGVIFDQSELSDLEYVDFEAQLKGGLWLVGNADLKAGNNPGFTNRISWKGCQFNEGPGVYGVIDDGGTDHVAVRPNHNGGLNHVRAAGVNGLTFQSGEWESAAGASVLLTSTSLAGSGVGSCNSVTFDGAPIIVPVSGQPCVSIASAGTVVFNGPFFGNTTSQKVTGCANANAIFAFGCVSGGGGAMFDGLASNHFQIDNNGAVVTNLSGIVKNPIPIGSQLTWDDVSGPTYQSYQEHISASPWRYHSIVSKGGAGGWAGAFRVQLNFNGGALFDAFKVEGDGTGTACDATLAGRMNLTGTGAAYKIAGTTVLNGQMAHIANLGAAPTAADFNNLLAELQTVKLMG